MRALFYILSLVAFILPASAAEKPGMLVTKAETLGRTPSNLVVERVELAALPAALDLVQGDLKAAPQELPKAINALRGKVGEAGLSAADAPLVMFTAIDDKRFSAQILLPLSEKPKEPPSDLTLSETPKGQALRIVHKGSLESLEDTYFELQTFTEDGDFEINDRMIERYLTDPAVTAPDSMVTEIYVLLK